MEEHAGVREFAIALARDTGGLLLAMLERGLDRAAIREKAGHFDIVTEADEAAEQRILQAIGEAYPEHAILSEESASAGNAGKAGAGPFDALDGHEWLWLIDPVDGTSNYAHGLPFYAVNIALAHRGAPVLGITDDPSAGRTYWAEQGQGAWVRDAAGQDQRIHASRIDEIRKALLSTGFAAERVKERTTGRQEFLVLDRQAQAVRRLGSAALSMAWVAAGYLEAYWEESLKPWDYGAGWLLVTEAGGSVTQYDLAAFHINSPNLIASNGQAGVHTATAEAIAAVRRGDGLAGSQAGVSKGRASKSAGRTGG